jgi:ABC-type dipeptide/oligopeptide/nickel transport system ATPase component
VVRLIAGTVSVICAGRVVEAGPVEEVFRAATTPYGRELIDPIPGRPAPGASGGGEAARPGSSGRRPAP